MGEPPGALFFFFFTAEAACITRSLAGEGESTSSWMAYSPAGCWQQG